jgi:hypothetical protein
VLQLPDGRSVKESVGCSEIRRNERVIVESRFDGALTSMVLNVGLARVEVRAKAEPDQRQIF